MKLIALGSGSTGQGWRLSLGALGVAMAFLAAPSALADESDATLAGIPAVEVATQTAQAPASVPAETSPTAVTSAAAGASAVTSAAAGASAVTSAAAGAPAVDSAPSDATASTSTDVPVSHLSSPQNLPPGTTDAAPQKQTRLGYLREMLHAIQTQDVSMSDAVLFLAQRPLDASASPPPGVSMGPSGPVGTSAPAAVVAPAAGAATP